MRLGYQCVCAWFDACILSCWYNLYTINVSTMKIIMIIKLQMNDIIIRMPQYITVVSLIFEVTPQLLGRSTVRFCHLFQFIQHADFSLCPYYQFSGSDIVTLVLSLHPHCSCP